MEELLAQAHARLHGPAAATAPLPPSREELDATALWAWVEHKDAKQKLERPWFRDRVADSHVTRRRNLGESGGISGSAWAPQTSATKLSFIQAGRAGHAMELQDVRRRPATAGARRPPPPPPAAAAAAGASLEPVRPLARSRRRRTAAALVAADAGLSLGMGGFVAAKLRAEASSPWEQPGAAGTPLAVRPQSAAARPYRDGGSGVAVNCMNVNSGWMWGQFEGRYGKDARHAIRLIQRRWRATQKGRAVRREFLARMFTRNPPVACVRV